MKHILAAVLIALAAPAYAEGWHFEASLEGGAEFWTFTNEDGDVSPRRIRGNEVWITRTDEVNDLGPGGRCDFNNCSVAVQLEGHSPEVGARVEITFSNGEALAFDARGRDVIFDNFSTAGMGATNMFVENIRAAEWVEINFGGRQHRFNLAGSSRALDAIHPYLR